MLELLIGILGAGVALVAFTLYKVRNMHRMLFRLSRQVSEVLPRQLDEQFRQLEALANLRAEIEPVGILPPTRGWAASPDFLVVVASAAREHRPQCVVECSSGVSTIVLARCMQKNGSGHVYSLEHDPIYAVRTRDHLVRLGLAEWATVIDAPLEEQVIDQGVHRWYAKDKLPGHLTIDMLIIDGPPADTQSLARYPAGPVLFPRLSENGRVYLDDADRQDEREIVARWLARFAMLQHANIPTEKGCVMLWNRPGNVSNR
jgi:predicted O-methyltransferase YrrM